MTEETMPDGWVPATRTHVRAGRSVRVWTHQNHSMAYRGTTPEAWEAFRRECWEVVVACRQGQTVAHAHDNRHDPATRPVSAPQRLNLEDDT